MLCMRRFIIGVFFHSVPQEGPESQIQMLPTARFETICTKNSAGSTMIGASLRNTSAVMRSGGGTCVLRREMSSVLGGIKDRVLGVDKGSREKQFMDMRAVLTQEAVISLKDVRGMLYEHTSSWKSMIPGASGVDSMKKHVAIIDKMNKKQLDDPMSIRPSDKIKLAEAAETDVAHVDAILSMYNQFKIISVWLKYKQHKNEELPKSQMEMQEMQQFDKRLQYIAGELAGTKNLPYKGKKYTSFLKKNKGPVFR